MIYLQMGNNGLGNQLHIYALGLVLQQRYGKEKVLFDMTQATGVVRGRKMNKLKDILGTEMAEASFSKIRHVTGMRLYKCIYIGLSVIKNDDYLYGYINRLWKNRKNVSSTCVIEEGDLLEKNVAAIYKLIDNTEKDCYLVGYWQDIAFSKQEVEYIRENIRINHSTDAYKVYASKMESTNSVSLHIRRGDYRRKESTIQFCTCHKSYYDKAMAYMESLDKEVQYYIFSDDMDYAKKLYADRDNVTFVEGCTDYEDLLLMSKCNKNIIANSTFSFWGAFLNAHNDAVVVSPKTKYLKKINGYWKAFPMCVPEDWIVI